MLNKYAFTLVELIVVVTILAILATIGFVSYSGYLTGVRDTNRIASLTAISDGLELYSTKNDLPDPDDAIDIQIEGVVIANQGYVGSNVLQTIEYSKAGKDPKDDSYYSYYLTDDKEHYQLMAFLEESDNLETNIISQSKAATDYKNRYPKVYGKRLGILTDDNNSPVQDIITGVLNFTGGTNSKYIARFTDSDILEGSGSVLKTIAGDASCKRIKELEGSSKTGVYSINPSGTEAFDVYCDMTTDRGGWTYATMLADTTTKNLFHTGFTGLTKNIISLTEKISTKGDFDRIWADTQNKDILIQCFTESGYHKGYETPFIIYDYLYADKGNLTKSSKSDSVFSSNNLKAKWGNLKYTLDTRYGYSGYTATHYIREDSSDKRVLMFYGGDRISVSNGNFQNSPSWEGTSGDRHINISVSNYCVTAIR